LGGDPVRRKAESRKHEKRPGQVRVVEECFLLVPIARDTSTARRLLAASEQDLQGIPRLWMDGVLDAAIAAAEHICDAQALHRYGELQQDVADERAQEVDWAVGSSASEPATS
ncbi:hypothetical protein ACFWBA_35705, partial [Streptomyces sp. NPDC059949]